MKHSSALHFLPIGAFLAGALLAMPAIAEPFTCGQETLTLRGEDYAYTDSLDTAHFRVRYTSDPASVDYASPEYVAAAAEFAEVAWSIYHDEWGLPAPRGWLEDTGSGGLPLMRFLIHDIPDASGYGTIGGGFDGTCASSSTSGIRVRNSMTEISLRTVIAHELLHAFQYAIQPGQPDWFKESTARWAEWQIVPEFRRSDSLSLIVRIPYETLWVDYPYTRTYGGVIFWEFLQERHGAPIALEVIRNSCQEYFWIVLDRILREDHGSSLDQALVEFWQWNYHAGSAADGRHYDSSVASPRISFQDTHDLRTPVDAILPTGLRARPVGTNALLFHGPAHQRELRVRIDGEPETFGHRIVSVYATTNPATHRKVAEGPVDGNGDFEAWVEDWDLVDDVGVLVTNLSRSGEVSTHLDYRYEAEEQGDPVFDVAWDRNGSRMGDVTLLGAPNPLRQATQIRYRSDGGPTRLQVVDITGRAVRALVDRSLEDGHYTVTWDARDDAGRFVANGVYFVRLSSGSRSGIERIVVLR
jgi:hypothetical protein